MILAYYLTGDLRLREVVDEWQKTITTDRANPEFPKVDRSRKPTSGRDNNNALGELIDLYQLDYNPAVLAWIGDLYEHQFDDMWEWGQRLHNVLLFHGSERVAGLVREWARATPAERAKLGLSKSLLSPHEVVALAAITDHDSKLAAKAYETADPLTALIRARTIVKRDPETFATNPLYFTPVPDYLLFLPRVMYAMNEAGLRGGTATVSELLDSQPMLQPAKSYFHCIVREDKDQAFDISITGRIGKDGAPVLVFDPDNKKIIETVVPPPMQEDYKITVPRDGKTGQYSILLKNEPAIDIPIQLPLTKLPGEVYQMQPNVMWVQGGHSMRPFTRFYTRSRGATPETVKIGLLRMHHTRITDYQTGKVLAERTSGEKSVPEDFVEARMGPQGVWIQAWGIFVQPQTPLTLAVAPDRWFAPDQNHLALDTKPQ
jgi:hypothetical protein